MLRYPFIALLLLVLWQAGYGWVSEQEPNDQAAQANIITCGDTVVCATLPDAMDTDCFRFYAVATDSIIATTFSCANSNTNTYLALYNASDSLLVLNNNGGPMYFSRVRWRAAYSGQYLLRVYRSATSIDTTYNLFVDCPAYVPEDYDLCSSPRAIPALPYFDENGSTLGATHQCGTLAPDVFYQFNNPAVSNIFIDVCTNQFDARVQILGQCCVEFFDDNDTGCDSGASLVSFELQPGLYYILVEGTTANRAGNFSLEVNAQMPGCPAPGPVVITDIGGYPFLDWPESVGPDYYVVWVSYSPNGLWEHLGSTLFTFFTDSTGYNTTRKFYKVSAVCPW